MEPRFKPNRVTLALTYALLEWTLIFLLFLNSLFSYLITKFALYFKLKPPCLLCSRIDHILEPHNSQHSYKNLICEHHSAELSKSGPCLGVLGGTQLGDLVSGDGFVGNSDHGFLFPQVGGDEDVVLEAKGDGAFCAYENDTILPQQHLEFYIDNDDYGLIPVEFFGSLDQERSGQVWRETDDELVFEPDGIDVMKLDEPKIQDLANKQEVGGFVRLDETKIEDLPTVNGTMESDADVEIKEEVDADVEVDGGKVEKFPTIQGQGEETKREVYLEADGDKAPDDQATEEGEVDVKITSRDFEDVCIEERDEFVIENGDVHVEEPYASCHEEGPSTSIVICEASTDTLGLLENGHYGSKKTEEEGEIGKENEDNEVCHKERDEFGIESDNVHVEKPSASCHEEGPSTNIVICEASTDNLGLLESGHCGSKKTEEEGEISKENERNEVCHKERDEFDIASGNVHVEEPSTTSVICEVFTDTSHLVEGDLCDSKKTEEEGESGKENERSEVEEDRAPDTPTSIDSLQLLHRKLLLLGRSKIAKEGSVDGSVVDDLEYGGGEVTIEELKSELRAERKASRALYEELEEERSAAAIAASHTMAMINRLQEDKAIIEMEALQYQRMMEEQAEYDQEALQLMNDILVKREREKKELERELEVSRKKLMDYEEREIINQGKDTTSSAFSSNKEESDGLLSIESSNGSKENGHHDTSTDAILSLKDSLSSFEEERISILEQLKVLEENLCTLAEEEDHQIRNMKTFEEFYQDSAEELSRSFKLNGDANGSLNMNGEHHQVRTTNGSKPKQLLPLLDEAATGSDNESSDEDEGRLDPFLLDGLPMSRFESEKRRFTIEEEVERLYERLQALEADREFIKHCFGTLRKGDRGIYLLQEILQHLRDLKNVEFRARNFDAVC